MPAKRNKKGPTKGSGGKGKRALQGKKDTLPAEQRHWYPKKQHAKAVKQEKRAEQKSTPDRTAPAGRRNTTPSGKDGSELLVGRNPVVEALRSGVPATKLFLANSLEQDSRVTEAARLAGEAGVAVHEVRRAELDRQCENSGHEKAAHQGLVLQVRPYRYCAAEDLLEPARQSSTSPLVVALDGVTDPHNLGAVARSAAAFGAHGLLVPERRAAGVTTAAWKTSAGALARLPVAQATNLSRALASYKQEGLFVAGLASEGDTRLDELPVASDPLAIVVGSEGKGVSRLVRETCDVVATIPISGAESLNASVAAGVSLYEVNRRRAFG